MLSTLLSLILLAPLASSIHVPQSGAHSDVVRKETTLATIAHNGEVKIDPGAHSDVVRKETTLVTVAHNGEVKLDRANGGSVSDLGRFASNLPASGKMWYDASGEGVMVHSMVKVLAGLGLPECYVINGEIPEFQETVCQGTRKFTWCVNEAGNVQKRCCMVGTQTSTSTDASQSKVRSCVAVGGVKAVAEDQKEKAHSREEERKEILGYFTEADTNNDGFLEFRVGYNEWTPFTNKVKQNEARLAGKDFSKIFTRADLNRDSKISRNEILKWLKIV